jgi:hypothetical protein
VTLASRSSGMAARIPRSQWPRCVSRAGTDFSQRLLSFRWNVTLIGSVSGAKSTWLASALMRVVAIERISASSSSVTSSYQTLQFHSSELTVPVANFSVAPRVSANGPSGYPVGVFTTITTRRFSSHATTRSGVRDARIEGPYEFQRTVAPADSLDRRKSVAAGWTRSGSAWTKSSSSRGIAPAESFFVSPTCRWPGQDSNLRATDYETQVFPAYNVFAGF